MPSTSDLAKYPFLPVAANYVKDLGIDVNELESPIYEKVIDRAEERILDALKSPTINKRYVDDNIEILSFPVAMMMLSHFSNDYLTRRFALMEAKKAYDSLRVEADKKILEISAAFKWDLRFIKERGGKFLLSISDYLRASVRIKESRWRLINKHITRGYVKLTKSEAARLMQEEITLTLKNKLQNLKPNLPNTIKLRLMRIKKWTEVKEEFPTHVDTSNSLKPAAFPSCIKSIYDSVVGGRNISHIERFTITTFLANLGLGSEELVNIFKTLPDFDDEKTRYQIEHIMGSRGVRRHYIPPKCEKLRTHGLCKNVDETCRKVRHPLSYYRRKAGRLLSEQKPS